MPTKIIRLFLASSGELKADREQFELMVNRKNKELAPRDTFIQLEIWEDHIDHISPDRLQAEYNKLVQQCDIFVMLFHTKVGQYTLEEFDAAYAAFESTGRPIIYTYFKTAAISPDRQNRADMNSLFDFQDKLDKMGHFYTRYNSIEDLKHKFSQQLIKLEDKGFFGKKSDDERPPNDAPPISTQKTDLSRLPTIDPIIYGREKELQRLRDAWADPKIKVISFIAWGGVGKSALVNAWLNEMEEKGFDGAQRVFGWSFYSQGTKEQGQTSADGFFNDAFQWFGYQGDMPKSQHEKGRLLANVITNAQETEPKTQNSKPKTLLILDGLEPLQYAPGEMHGRLKDPAMAAFLKTLVRNLNGLCVISSRVPVTDLKSTDGKASRTQALGKLSEAAGIAVLKGYGLKGPQAEFAKAVEEFKGHALALNLVGSYLRAFHNGHIQQRDRIEKLTEDETHGGHARRVMESYEKVFLRKKNFFSKSYGPEWSVLHILGLFDRPATKEAIAVIRAKPAIKGLTNKLKRISEKDWQKALNHLRALRLIAEKDPREPDTLDCHPLIREHFGQNLQQQQPEAWKAAHSRLYEYYKNLPEKELPDKVEEMEPLFAAVMHGCLAGKHQEALGEVFYKRIRRKNEGYSVHKLGAIGADLACLSSFFESLWDQPADGLTAADQAVTLGWAGFALRAVGRLAEAAQPMKAGLEMSSEQNNNKECSIISSNLSELSLTLGDVAAAQAYGAQSVTYADRSKDGFWMEASRSKSADALHQAGDLQAAEKLFREAEAMQQERQPSYPYLYSLRGFQFCDLLLAKGKYQEVLERARKALEIVLNGSRTLLDIALNTLTIGKALMLQVLDQHSKAPSPMPQTAFQEATHFLNQAVEGLREAGDQEFIARGLINRATLHRHTQAFSKAWEDLDEALEIATYGQMKLFLTDYHLEAARLVQAQAQVLEGGDHFEVMEMGETMTMSRAEMQARFLGHVAAAERLVAETGYHRRDGEVEALRD